MAATRHERIFVCTDGDSSYSIIDRIEKLMNKNIFLDSADGREIINFILPDYKPGGSESISHLAGEKRLPET